MVDLTPTLPGLSPVRCKPLDVRFDGGVLSPDGGLLVFREVEERLRLADRLAGCLKDPRNQGRVDHTLAEVIRFRMLAIVAGYEDGNDCNTLRHDPIFKIALGRLPERGEELCSQSTVSRLENLPSRPDLYRIARALVDQYCALLRDNQNRSPSDNLPYIRWWSSVWRASWCQARSRQRREPKGLGFTAVCLPDIIIAGCSFRWMKLSSVSEA